MHFHIDHLTQYEYAHPAAEAYAELRLAPPELPSQRIIAHRLKIDPPGPVSEYTDHHGNRVAFFSVPHRHSRLQIHSEIEAETCAPALPEPGLGLPVGEARQILTSCLPDIFGYLQFTDVVCATRESHAWARRIFRANRPLREACQALVSEIHGAFAYQSGSTENSTPLAAVWKQRRGVCQDFAHVALAVARTAGMPCRYVCGYIETDPPPAPEGGARPRRLIGSTATHAWVELLVPGQVWVALDPTNNQWCGARHLAVAYGGDYREAAPVRGTFKGSGAQQMRVRVRMLRDKPN